MEGSSTNFNESYSYIIIINILESQVRVIRPEAKNQETEF